MALAGAYGPSSAASHALIVAYRVDLGDLTAGTAGAKDVTTTLGGLTGGHHYVVRVRALELKNGNALAYSAASADAFVSECVAVAQVARYVAYNPFPECIQCGGLQGLYDGDPVMQRELAAASPAVSERIVGLQIDAGGAVTFVTG